MQVCEIMDQGKLETFETWRAGVENLSENVELATHVLERVGDFLREGGHGRWRVLRRL